MNRNPCPRELRTFGLAMLAGFGVIGGLLWFRGWHGAAVVLWALGATSAMLSFFSPPAARPLYIAWMTAGTYLGMVMSTVVLTVLFFTLLPLFALIRLSDPLRLRLKREGTYWEDYRPHEPTIERIGRPF